MPDWRNYIDPKDNQKWWTDDSANWIPDTKWQTEKAPSTQSGGGGGNNKMPVVGGLDQLALYNQTLQQQYLLKMMEEIEKPRLTLDQQKAAWDKTKQLADMGGWMPYGSPGTAGWTPPAAGTYQTANGPRTMEQMRAEIVKASKG